MESRDRIGKILLVTLVLILAFVAWKRTNSSPSAVTSVDGKSSAAESLVVKQDVEKIVKEFILANPEVLIESIETMQRRKIEEMSAKAGEVIKQRKAEIEEDKNSPFVGAGDVKIVMIYDYNCGYCKKANLIIEKLISDQKNIKIIYKPYPVLGESSEYMSKVVLSVFKLFPDKFTTIHNALMEAKISSREDVVQILEKNNIAVTTIESEFENQAIKDTMAKTMEFAGELRIHGVPAFIINESLYPGLLDLDRIKSIINNSPKVPVQVPSQVVVPEAVDKK